MKKILRWLPAILIIAGIITSLLPSAKPAPKLEIVKFVPVLLDFSQIQMPADAQLAIEAQGSALYLNEGKTRIVFWKEDQTIQVTGYQTETFTCAIGVVYVRFNGWHVYYDCQTGRIVASNVAYPVGVMSFANWAPVNIDWKVVDGTVKTNGWKLEIADGENTLMATSPLGKELRITPKQVVAVDGSLSVVYEYPAAAWLLQIGGPDTDSIVIVVKPSETGWNYGIP